MTEEERDEREFEELWKQQEWKYANKFAFGSIIEKLARYWFKEGRRTLRERIKTVIELPPINTTGGQGSGPI